MLRPLGIRSLEHGGPQHTASVDLLALLRSAGVGRTGVFITLSIVLERMRYEGVVDIFQTVKMLRTQRPAMVQTEVSTSHHLLPVLPGKFGTLRLLAPPHVRGGASPQGVQV